MNLSISDFLDWKGCPHRAGVKRAVGKWVPPGSALGIGVSFHKGLELKLAGRPITGMDLEACVSNIATPKDAKVARSLLAALDKLEMPEGTAKGSEVLVTGDLRPGLLGVGRLDGLWETPAPAMWSVQGKTISSSRPIAHELERVKNSFHEIFYAELARRTGIELAGTLVIVGVKLSQKARDEGQREVFWEFMPRSEMAVKARFDNMLPELLRCADDLARPGMWAHWFKDTESCLGKYGNSPCPLFAACHQGADLRNVIETSLTYTLEDRYGDVQAD